MLTLDVDVVRVWLPSIDLGQSSQVGLSFMVLYKKFTVWDTDMLRQSVENSEEDFTIEPALKTASPG